MRLLLASAFVVILNETILGVALPHLMVDLGINADSAQWLTTAFMLTMAVVIPTTGYLIQRFHTRQLFVAAMSLFSSGTAIAALAPGFDMLLAGRIVQATGTAIMLPLLMTTVMNVVPSDARGRTMGKISIVIAVAPAIGPTVSGVILSFMPWQGMFILVLPIALASLVAGIRRLQNVTVPQRSRIDAWSVVVCAFGFGGFVYGISNVGGASGPGGFLRCWGPLFLGLLLIGSFLLRQRALQSDRQPLLDLRVFGSRNFTLSTISFLLTMLAFFGAIAVLPLYLQDVLRLSPLATGLLLLPGGLVLGALAPFVGKVYDAVGPRPLVATGSVVIAVVLAAMSTLGPQSSFWWVLGMHVGLSAGLALLFTPLFAASLGSLPQTLYSHGSAVIGTVQQLAGAAGTAAFIAVMTSRASSASGDQTGNVSGTAAGIRLAFMIGAGVAVLAVPIACSIRDTGRSLAVKVNHPGDRPAALH